MLEALAILFVFLFPAFGMAWTDGVSTKNIGSLTLDVSDTVNNWSDASAKVAGGVVSVSDSITLTDDAVLRAQGLRSATDDLNAWSDGIVKVADGRVPVSDTLNNWNDAVVNVPGHAVNASDSISQSDEVAYRAHGTQVYSDSTPGFSDAVSTYLDILSTPLTQSASDTSNNWSDFTPGTSLSYLATVTDQLPSFADAVSVQTRIAITASDSFSLGDHVDTAIPLGLVTSDSFTLADFIPAATLQYTVRVTGDAVSLTDNASYGAPLAITVSDDLAAWNDSVAKSTSLSITATDSFPNWSETVFTLPNAPLRVFPGDNVNHFQDPAFLLGFGHQLLIDESVNNWQETVSIASPILLVVSDTAGTITDSVTRVPGVTVQAADSFSQSDAVSSYRTYGFEDSFSLSDSVRVQLDYRYSVEDDAGYADDGNSIETHLASANELSINVVDVLSFSDDAIAEIPIAPLAIPSIGATAILPPLQAPADLGAAVLPPTLISTGSAAGLLPVPVQDIGGAAAVRPPELATTVGAVVLAEPVASPGYGMSALEDSIQGAGQGISIVGGT